MIHSEAAALAKTVLKSGLDVFFFGPEGCGKTQLCRSLDAKAPLLNAAELKADNLVLLRSLATAAPVVILENIEAQNLLFLRPFLASRTLLGTPFECRFLITAREDHPLEGAAHIRLAPIEASAWLVWAQENRIHPALRLLVENDERILARHSPRRLENLSKLLSARPSNRSLRAAIESVLGNDEAALLALLSAMSEPASPFESNEEAIVEKARTGTEENARRFETELIAQFKAGPGKEAELRLLHYLREAPPKEAVKLLGGLIDAPKAQAALERVLADPAVRKLIDAALGELL